VIIIEHPKEIKDGNKRNVYMNFHLKMVLEWYS